MECLFAGSPPCDKQTCVYVYTIEGDRLTDKKKLVMVFCRLIEYCLRMVRQSCLTGDSVFPFDTCQKEILVSLFEYRIDYRFGNGIEI